MFNFAKKSIETLMSQKSHSWDDGEALLDSDSVKDDFTLFCLEHFDNPMLSKVTVSIESYFQPVHGKCIDIEDIENGFLSCKGDREAEGKWRKMKEQEILCEISRFRRISKSSIDSLKLLNGLYYSSLVEDMTSYKQAMTEAPILYFSACYCTRSHKNLKMVQILLARIGKMKPRIEKRLKEVAHDSAESLHMSCFHCALLRISSDGTSSDGTLHDVD